MMTGDFEAMRACLVLPYEVETFEGRLRVETEADLRSMFEHMQLYYRATGVTALARRCLEAEFRDANTISGLFETRLIHFGNRLERPPFATFVEIRRIAGDWKVARGQYLLDDTRHGRALIYDPSAGGSGREPGAP